MIKIRLTKHSIDKMAWLGISEEQIKEAIERGSKYKQTDGVLAKHTYISVAYKKIKDYYLIKTVYIER